MQSSFNSLQKPNQMSGSIFEGELVVLGKVCSNLLSTFDLEGKCKF